MMPRRPPSPPPATAADRPTEPRLLLGLAIVFGLFQYLGTALGSDRGQAGVLIAAVIVGALLSFEWLLFGRSLRHGASALGLGRPQPRGLVAAAVVCVALLLVAPLAAWWAGTTAGGVPQAERQLLGLFMQAGVAEEVLFRGYLFNHLRRGRSFWAAAWLSMVPFAVVHLWLFATMPAAVAAAALLLSCVVALPLAHLFEVGGGTIWPPALVHFVVQAGAKLIAFESATALPWPIVWMAASAVVPWAALWWARDRQAKSGPPAAVVKSTALSARERNGGEA
jgi:membrane protease YdiL (CAAX protease family)